MSDPHIWKTRIKGRDYYDMVWYLGKKAPCHLEHLKERMFQTGHLRPDEVLNRETLIEMLCSRFGQIDFDKAGQDVRPFVRDQRELDLWTQDFFCDIVRYLEVC